MGDKVKILYDDNGDKTKINFSGRLDLILDALTYLILSLFEGTDFPINKDDSFSMFIAKTVFEYTKKED